MNLFENPKYYDKDEYFSLSEAEQNELFLHIRSWLPKVPEAVRYKKDKYKQEILNRIEQVCAYACSGHVPSQDYMGYIYKRGFLDGKEGFLWCFMQGWWYRTLVDIQVYQIKHECHNDKAEIQRYLKEQFNIRF